MNEMIHLFRKSRASERSKRQAILMLHPSLDEHRKKGALVSFVLHTIVFLFQR